VLARARNSFRMRSYEKCVRKCFRMRSYEFIGLKVPWNEQLQERVGVPPGRGPDKGPSKSKLSGFRPHAVVSCVVVDFSGRLGSNCVCRRSVPD